MILLDTSGLLAALDESQTHHEACRAALVAAQRPFLLSPFVLAELDYLLATQVGMRAELALLDEVARSVYQLESFGSADVDAARAVIAKYADLDIGLADASIVVLSERHDAFDILTLDLRHFSSLRGARGKRFRIVPRPGA